MTDFSQYLQRYQQRINTCLQHRIDAVSAATPPLGEAMSYSLMGPGKRLRPILAYAAAESVGTLNAMVDTAACAVESVHAYSLIHDDLPAMDDDDLRRGLPTCHKAFDEATAILAGDALQTLAFQWLAEAGGEPLLQLRLIRELAAAAGYQGMVAGQIIDLKAVGKALDLSALENLHRRKTGALIQASVRMGGIASQAASDDQLMALARYADAVGLAFQIHDDILDVEATTETLGKLQGADARLNKPTYVTVAGLDRAKALARQQIEKANDALSGIQGNAELLRQLANYMITRRF